jgi:putative colanic acid biosynthesis UDP-glucose lipid carrier transferase
MSIVGPRPHAIEMNGAYARLLPLYETRHRVKPGITGWAQINDHRGPTYTVDDMRARLDHDLYYIENWSLLFDLSIIAATPFIGLTHKNAL